MGEDAVHTHVVLPLMPRRVLRDCECQGTVTLLDAARRAACERDGKRNNASESRDQTASSVALISLI
jgi:hypothetical protein